MLQRQLLNYRFSVDDNRHVVNDPARSKSCKDVGILDIFSDVLVAVQELKNSLRVSLDLRALSLNPESLPVLAVQGPPD